MLFKHVRKVTHLIFEDTIIKKENISKIFKDIKEINIPFEIIDIHNKTINGAKIIKVYNDSVMLVDKQSTGTLRFKIKYEDILNLRIETTAQIERALGSREWRALEV